MLPMHRSADSMPPETGFPSPIGVEEAGSLCGLLLARARRTPDRPAYMRFDPSQGAWVTRTWAQALTQVGRWQAALAAEGLAPGERVAIMMANRPEWVYFDLAALGLGLVTVPLFPGDRPESIRHVLKDSGARMLLLETGAMGAALVAIADTLARLDRVLVLEPDPAPLPGVRFRAVCDWLLDLAPPPVDRVSDPTQLATLVYTSGTTGPAKGVMLSHRNILWNASAGLELIPAFESDRFLSFLPLSHTLERTVGLYLPMMAGAEVVYARSIPQLAEDFERIRPTAIVAVPRIFERIHARVQEALAAAPAAHSRLFERAVQLGWERFEHEQGRAPWSPRLMMAPVLDRLVGTRLRARFGGRIRVAVCGGAPLSPEIARTFLALGVPIVQGYGLTEASPVVSVNPLESNRPETVGLPLPGVELRMGAQNELLVRSPGVMAGYWGQPRASAAAVDRDGWLRTGDQARIEAGHLAITGRLKDTLVLSTGEKVAPMDIEGAIATDPLFSQVVVVGEGRPYLAALAVLDPRGLGELAAEAGLPEDPSRAIRDPRLEDLLIERMDRRLTGFPAYAKIRRVAALQGPWSIEDDLMTPTLKLKRARILARYRDQVAGLYSGHS